MTDYSDLLGKPWESIGRGPRGFDCWGIVIEVARRNGIAVPDYGHIHHKDRFLIDATFAKRVAEWEAIEKTRVPQLCDVACFKRTDGGLHFGIVVEGGHFIHCQKGLGVQMPRLSHPVYRQLIQRFYRLKR